MPANNKKYGLGKAKQTGELELPSGNTCLVIRPGVQGLMKAGILDSLDSLLQIVQVEHIDANDPKAMAAAARKATMNPGKLLEGMEIVDKVICYVLREPKVHMDPDPDGNDSIEVEGERYQAGDDLPDGHFWVSEVDLEDKMFIFQFVVGGTRDLETFRSQRDAVMDSLANVAGVSLPAQ